MPKNRRAAAGLILAGAGLAFMAALGPAYAASPIVGGYAEQDPSKPEFRQVLETAEKLLEKKHPGRDLRLTKLREVYTQVVAGVNYKLVCDYKDRQGSGKAELVVYRNLSDEFSLTDAKMTEGAAGAAEGAQRKRFEYATTFGGAIVVELLDGDRISVAYGETRHVLPRAVSGSGARYSADGVTFWMKGDDAVFENEKTDERVRCSTRNPQRP